MVDSFKTMQERARAIIIQDGFIILVKRVRQSDIYYVFPGGGVEPNETPEQAVLREVKEETGLEINPEKFLGVVEMILPEMKLHRLVFYYMAKMTGGAENPGGDISELRWCRPEDIEKMENLGDATLPALELAKQS